MIFFPYIQNISALDILKKPTQKRCFLFLLPPWVINQSHVHLHFCSDIFCVVSADWVIPLILHSQILFLHFHVLLFLMVFLILTYSIFHKNKQELIDPVPFAYLFILNVGRTVFLEGKWTLHVGNLPVFPTSSSLSCLSQFLHLSQLTAAVFQFTPAGKHAETAKQFLPFLCMGWCRIIHMDLKWLRLLNTQGHSAAQRFPGSLHACDEPPSAATWSPCEDQNKNSRTSTCK